MADTVIGKIELALALMAALGVIFWACVLYWSRGD